MFHTASVVPAAGAGHGRLRPLAGAHVAADCAEVLGDLAEPADARRPGRVLLERQHAGDEQSQLAEQQRLDGEEPDDAQQERQHGGDFHCQHGQDGQYLLLQLTAACENTGETKQTTIRPDQCGKTRTPDVDADAVVMTDTSVSSVASLTFFDGPRNFGRVGLREFEL